MNEDEATDAFYKLIYQRTFERTARLKRDGLRIAHYTSAENALNIISGRTLWLRNAAVMNDFMEVTYGRDCVVSALKARMDSLKMLLNDTHLGLAEEVVTWLAEVEFTARK